MDWCVSSELQSVTSASPSATFRFHPHKSFLNHITSAVFTPRAVFLSGPAESETSLYFLIDSYQSWHHHQIAVESSSAWPFSNSHSHPWLTAPSDHSLNATYSGRQYCSREKKRLLPSTQADAEDQRNKEVWNNGVEHEAWGRNWAFTPETWLWTPWWIVASAQVCTVASSVAWQQGVFGRQPPCEPYNDGDWVDNESSEVAMMTPCGQYECVNDRVIFTAYSRTAMWSVCTANISVS